MNTFEMMCQEPESPRETVDRVTMVWATTFATWFVREMDIANRQGRPYSVDEYDRAASEAETVADQAAQRARHIAPDLLQKGGYAWECRACGAVTYSWSEWLNACPKRNR